MPSFSHSAGLLRIAGALDLGAAEELRNALSGALRETPELTLDLLGVESCHTACFQLLYAARRTASARGTALKLAGVSPAVADAAGALGLPLERLTGSQGREDDASVV